ncbi:MAG: hypothetical protein QNJ97_10135 [Myxococcota bacterium]|nr:hypothetical protein [Myxococcota bacterium]
MTAVEAGDFEAVEALVSEEPRAIRYMVRMMYGLDKTVRENCAKAIVIAAKYHPKVVARVVQNLVWAMDQRSGTYAPTAPEVLKSLAEAKPELLVPVMGELVRLAGDTSLNTGLCDTLRLVAERCPGELGEKLRTALEMRLRYGDNVELRNRK